MEGLTKELLKDFNAKQQVVMESMDSLRSSYESYTSSAAEQPPLMIWTTLVLICLEWFQNTCFGCAFGGNITTGKHLINHRDN